MKNKLFKSLILLGCLSIGASATLPVLMSSCTSKNWDYEYDSNNKELNLNANSLKELPDSNDIFKFYKSLLQLNDETLKNSIVESINKLTNLNLTISDINFVDSQLNLSNFSIIFPLISSSKIGEISNISIIFNSYSQQKIDNFLNENFIQKNLSSVLPNYTLEEILGLPDNNLKKLTDEQIKNAVGLSSDSVLLHQQNSSERLGKIETIPNSSIRQLSLLYFDPNTGLGKLNIRDNSIDSTCKPTQKLLDLFGNNVTNDWTDIFNLTVSTPNEWTFTTGNTITPTLPENLNLSMSYNDFLSTNVTAKTLASNYLSNESKFKDDYAFFLKTYLNDVFKSWKISDLLTTSIYVCNNIKIENKKVNGSIGIQIFNNSSGTKLLTLPITNESRIINPNSNTIIALNFNDSTTTPTLVERSSINNDAYLSMNFSNVVMNVYYSSNVINFNNEENKDIEEESFTFSNANVFTNSYALKRLVTNVNPGDNWNESLNLIEQSKKSVSIDDLKNIKLEELTNSFNTTKIIVKAVEDIMLKVSSNISVYELLEQISSPIYNIINVLTNNANIASIISGLFTTDSTSVYLYNNVNNIINLLKSLDDGSSIQLTSIIDMLVGIIQNHDTPDKMHEWVVSIEGLYPTLEKLLGDGIKWILPLIGEIMTGISQDKPIIDFLFSNMDYILQYLSDPSITNNIGASTQNIIKSVQLYLNAIVEYSNTIPNKKDIVINSDPNKYKNIKALDIVAFELTNKLPEKSILTLIYSILSTSNPTIGDLLNTISNLLCNNIIVNQIVEDYSNVVWTNEIKTKNASILAKGSYTLFDAFTSYDGYQKPQTGTTLDLTEQLGKCIKSIFNVYVGNNTTPTLLSNILENNVEMIISENQFTYSNYSVNQNLKVKYNFKENVRFNLLPFNVLLDNIKVVIPKTTIDQLIAKLNQLIQNLKTDSTVPSWLQNVIGLIGTLNFSNINSVLYSIIGITLDANANDVSNYYINLSKIFPTDILIKPENSIILEYIATNSNIYPSISSNGALTWSYFAQENIVYNLEYQDAAANRYISIWDQSNKTFEYIGDVVEFTKTNAEDAKKQALINQKYYGCNFDKLYTLLFVGTKINSIKTGKTLVDAALSLLSILIPPVISLDTGISNITTIQTSNSNATIPNYNSSIYNPNYTVKQIKPTTDLTTELTLFVNNNVTWVDANDSTANKKQKTLLVDPNSLIELSNIVKKYYDINSNVNFQVLLSGSCLTTIAGSTYTYTLNIYLDKPVIYTTLANATATSNQSITQYINVSFAMNTAPTKPTSPEATSPTSFKYNKN